MAIPLAAGLGALQFLMEFVPRIPQFVSAGAEIANVVQTGMDKANQLKSENRNPTNEDWDQVNASIAAKRTRLHAPGA